MIIVRMTNNSGKQVFIELGQFCGTERRSARRFEDQAEAEHYAAPFIAKGYTNVQYITVKK